ncbi:hypothetical protein N5K35_24310 [Pseudomonas sp. GD03651]|uniref:hypothetical protein n=1 Tax=Pseudomonas TaxID=286 RepID=UPI00034F0908|nr:MULTISPECIES: hypothetical protein [Pseudomonas]AGN82825.1 hypothetical protein L483_20275 [Pseudomonas putida H8234]MDH2186816.1 hypothetical protein [Pseudomonas sp. GD03651]
MAYNTNNPLGSSDPRDLFDNSTNFDEGMNSTADSFLDRFGRPRVTWQKFHNLTVAAESEIGATVTDAKGRVNAAADAGIEDIDDSVAAVDAAEAAAKSQMEETAADLGDDFNTLHKDTLAELQAVIPRYDGNVGIVGNDSDATKNGWYQWNASTQGWVRLPNQPAMSAAIEALRRQVSLRKRPRGPDSGKAPLIIGAAGAKILFGVHQKLPRGPSKTKGTVTVLGNTLVPTLRSLRRPRSQAYPDPVVLVSGNSVMLKTGGTDNPATPVVTYDAKLSEAQGQKPAPKRYAAISGGQVWSYGPDGARQVTHDGEWFSAHCTDFDIIRALKVVSGGLVPYTITQDGRALRDGKVLVHKLSTGQSLALGSRGFIPDPNGEYVINGIRGNLFSPWTPPGYTDKLWTLAGGPRPSAWEGTTALEPVREYVAGVLGETPATSFMLATRKWHELTTSVSPQMLYSVSALGGTAYAGIKKGTATYANAISQVTTAKAIADSMGLDYVVPSISIVHGESQSSTTQAQYVAMQAEWISDYRADIVAITGQAVPPVAFISQMLTGDPGTIPQIPLAQLQAHNENPDIIMVGPKYAYPYFDTYHMLAPGYVKMGELEARAERLTQISGKWQPLKALSASVSGSMITLRLNNLPDGNAGTPGPIGKLVIDTTIVSDPGNYGFQLSAGTIGTVAMGADGVSIVITATAAIAAGTVLTYALQPTLNSPQSGNGRRGCIRDTDMRDFSRFDAKPLYNWLCAFSIALEI